MKKIIQPTFLIKVFGMETKITLGWTRLGKDVAKSVELACSNGGLGLMGVDLVDSADLVLDIFAPTFFVKRFLVILQMLGFRPLFHNFQKASLQKFSAIIPNIRNCPA